MSFFVVALTLLWAAVPTLRIAAQPQSRTPEARAERMSSRLHLQGDKQKQFQMIYGNYLRQMDSLMAQSRQEKQLERYAQIVDSFHLESAGLVRQLQQEWDSVAQHAQEDFAEDFRQMERQIDSCTRQVNEELEREWSRLGLADTLRRLLPPDYRPKKPGRAGTIADSVRLLLRRWKAAPTNGQARRQIESQYRRSQSMLNLRCESYQQLLTVLQPVEILRLYELERMDSERFRRELWRRQDKAAPKPSRENRSDRPSR